MKLRANKFYSPKLKVIYLKITRKQLQNHLVFDTLAFSTNNSLI